MSDNQHAKLKTKLEQWFSGHFPARESLAIAEFSSPTAGASNETLLFEINYRENGEPKSQALVARLEVSGEGVFPEYDLELQYQTMQRLQATGVKVPVMVAMESNPAVIGKPFYIMERLQGRYLTDNPPYQMEGWLLDESPDVRGEIWEQGIREMSAVHKVDWQTLGFSDLWAKDHFTTPLQQLLAYYENFFTWAESLGRPFDKLHPVLEYLKKNQPQGETLALCWGDAKPANLMIEKNGTHITGVLDWEMVHLGNPVHDLAWWFVLDDSLTTGLGLPKLNGLPDREQLITLWEQCSGHSAAAIDYYELLSNFQFAIIMHRVGTRMTAQGIFKPEDEFDIQNNSTLLIDEQIEKFGL